MQPSGNELTYSKLALGFLEKHRLLPTPEHYAIGYYYCMGRNRELIDEIDKLTANTIPFTPSITAQLYQKYIIATSQQKSADAVATNAQRILADVIKVIHEFSSGTKDYHQGIDQYVGDISDRFKGTGVEHLVEELVKTTVGMRQRSEKISKKLEESTQEIKTLKQSLQQVSAEAQRDFLTSVYNRKSFDGLAEEQLQAAREQQAELCLLMIDIDHFKQFNDRFGHLLGDEVLKVVAGTLTETLKGRDIVGRFGGEEFSVVLPETPLDGAMKVAEMIRSAIAGKELKRKDTGEMYGTITVSIGVARFHPGADTLASLIRRADDALYQSKRTGRNRVTREAA
ncbi:MAG: GGDEF domain-containing protein [Pseudomonadota bacterium]|nr:GGDEF domain-containing protein [Pseudomonadota bacterium]